MRTFRAWIDPRTGCNADRFRTHRDVRMVDLMTNHNRIILRLNWRLVRPRYFSVVAFFRRDWGTHLLRLGRL